MRELKFRAWDKANKQMSRILPWDDINRIEKRENWFPDFYFKYKDLEWMQFTGLKDKNGKEIFEGDVLKSKDGLIEVYLDFRSGGCTQFPVSGQYLSSAFVIPVPGEVNGNIYENHELLNSKSKG